MATLVEEQRNEKIENIRRELRRRSLDMVAVFNPLVETFQTVWEGFIHSVPSNQNGVFPRYIAEKWIKEIVDLMINRDEKEAVEKENKKRATKGFQPLNAHEERLNFDSAHGLLLNNEELRLKYMRMVYKGISKEHGLDLPEAPIKKIEKTPVHERLMKQLDEEIGVRHTLEDDGEENMESKKDDLIKELDEG